MRFGRKGTDLDRERQAPVAAGGVHTAAGEQTNEAVSGVRVSPEAHARVSGTGDKTGGAVGYFTGK